MLHEVILLPLIGPACCARAASGHAAAAPSSSVMNSRRFMSGMGTSSPMRYQRRRPAHALGFPLLQPAAEGAGKSFGQT